jgi:hypothetical protein
LGKVNNLSVKKARIRLNIFGLFYWIVDKSGAVEMIVHSKLQNFNQVLSESTDFMAFSGLAFFMLLLITIKIYM